MSVRVAGGSDSPRHPWYLYGANPTGREPGMSGDALNLVLAAVSIVVGAAVSYYFYRISRKERLPLYVVTGEVVVRGDANRDIEVRYKGDAVLMVSRTAVALWNAGREPIRRDDLVENHPLRVRLPEDAELLEARVLVTTKPEIDFACFPDDRYTEVNLGFSFLNHHDGGAIELLHTGEDPLDVSIEGAIVGVDGPPMYVEAPLWDDASVTGRMQAGVLLLLAGLSGLAAVGFMRGTQGWLALPAGAFTGLGLSILLVILLSNLWARRMDKWRNPPGSPGSSRPA
jgi:hypothetical protein